MLKERVQGARAFVVVLSPAAVSSKLPRWGRALFDAGLALDYGVVVELTLLLETLSSPSGPGQV